MKLLSEKKFLDNLKKAKLDLRAIEHDLRLQIIKYLDENPNSFVKEIYKTLEIEQSVASQHLAILRNSNFVIANRDGKKIFYSLNYDQINKVNDIVNAFVENSEK